MNLAKVRDMTNRVVSHLIALLWSVVLLLACTLPATAQTSPSAFTSGIRYDEQGRLTGTINPDPDGTGPLHFGAVRKSYDGAGRVIRVETGELAEWRSEAVPPADWTGFTIFHTLDTTYDWAGRKTRQTLSSGGAVQAITQYSYDNLGRLLCTAVRMNPAVYGSLPADACALGTTSPTYGADRITRNVYDAAGQLLQEQRAYGTQQQQNYSTYTYSPNGRRISMTDANGNRAEMSYDGYDRQIRWTFPSTTAPGQVNAADYEQYGYDNNGNRTTVRHRDGLTLTFQYDSVNRVSVKIVPERAGLDAANTRDVYYSFDLRGLQRSAQFDSLTGEGVTNTYDGLGRLKTSRVAMGGSDRTLTYNLHDFNGNRLQLTHPDGFSTSYGYDGLGRPTLTQESGASLDGWSYNAQGNAMGRSYGGGTAGSSAFGYDTIGRLASLSHDVTGTGADVSFSYGRNPASQIVSRTRSNDSYAWTGAYDVNRSYTVNGLNQYLAAGNATFGYDTNGNLTSDGANNYVYDVENRLVAASGAHSAALVYDPLGRLFQITSGASVTQFLYDGDELIGEYAGAGSLIRRYVHGNGADDPLVWYEGGARRYLLADHEGSIIGLTDGSGNLIAANSYDEWGIPGAANLGRFQYTGQAWLAELGLYHYKARIYSPTLGRFLQVDPVGYEGGNNLYAYVENDPVNRMDPTGQSALAICFSPAAPICASPGAIFVAFGVVEGWVLSMAGPPIDPANPPTLGGDISASDRYVSRNHNNPPPDLPVAFPPSDPRRDTPTDRIVRDHLTERDLQAARIESRGGTVGNRSDGRPWNHIQEVRDAQGGLRNRIGQINRELGHPNLNTERREALQDELSKASRNLDRSRRYLPY